jgi:hypothetical protein
MSVTPVEDIPQQKIWQVSVSEAGLLRFSTFTFPGWKTFIDDKEVPYTDNNKFKLITVYVPSGQHTIKAVFTGTPIRSLANVLSILSIIGVIGWMILKRKK